MLKKVTEFGYGVSSVISRTYTPANYYSILSSSITLSNAATFRTSNFLAPVVCSAVQACGMKVKGLVRKRCKDCYMVYKDHKIYNYCKTKPKHNQRNRTPNEKEYFILTEITHGRIRKY